MKTGGCAAAKRWESCVSVAMMEPTNAHIGTELTFAMNGSMLTQK